MVCDVSTNFGYPGQELRTEEAEFLYWIDVPVDEDAEPEYAVIRFYGAMGETTVHASRVTNLRKSA